MRLTGKNRGKVLCEECRQPLISAQNNAPGLIVCEICGTNYTGVFFQLADQAPSHAAADVHDMEDAQCFFHPGKEGVAICATCGRVLCSLCDIKQGDGDICPSCINDRELSDINGLSRRSWAYMQMAWCLLLISVVIPVIPACASLFFAIAGLRAQGYSYSVSRKISLALALLLAVSSIAVYSSLIIKAVLK